MLQSLQDAVQVVLLHLDEGEVLHQVDAAYRHLVALDVLVDKADNLAGEHAVYLADVEEEADVAFLGNPLLVLGAGRLSFTL